MSPQDGCKCCQKSLCLLAVDFHNSRALLACNLLPRNHCSGESSVTTNVIVKSADHLPPCRCPAKFNLCNRRHCVKILPAWTCSVPPSNCVLLPPTGMEPIMEPLIGPAWAYNVCGWLFLVMLWVYIASCQHYILVTEDPHS